MTGSSVKLVNNKKRKLKSVLKPTKQHTKKPVPVSDSSDNDSIDLTDSDNELDNEFDTLHGLQSDHSDNEPIDTTTYDTKDQFANAIDKLLKQDTITTIKNTLHNQQQQRIRAQAKDTDSTERTELLEQRKQKQRRLERRILLNKDHIIPQYTPVERQYIKIATRGVVQLFNAISKQQKLLSDAKKSMSKQELKKNTVATKDTFLQLLNQQKHDSDKPTVKTESDDSDNESDVDSTAVKSESDSDNDSSSDDEPVTKRPAKSTWSVLSDNYMLGSNKMKDWSASSSSDDDDNAVQSESDSDSD